MGLLCQACYWGTGSRVDNERVSATGNQHAPFAKAKLKERHRVTPGGSLYLSPRQRLFFVGLAREELAEPALAAPLSQTLRPTDLFECSELLSRQPGVQSIYSDAG